MKENRLPYNKNIGFRVPEGYFDGLENRILAKVTEATSPGFADKPERPFRVPEAYFEELEERVMMKVAPQEKPVKVIPLLQRESFYYAAGVAAVFIAIVSSFFFSRPQSMGVEDLDIVTIEKYLEESIDDSSAEISRMLSEELYSYAPNSRIGLDQEAVMEYLQENLEDPSVILNED